LLHIIYIASYKHKEGIGSESYYFMIFVLPEKLRSKIVWTSLYIC